jgi:hypothetical protein
VVSHDETGAETLGVADASGTSRASGAEIVDEGGMT